MLDCFTTSLSSSWAGDTSSFSISNNQLLAAADKAIFWGTSFGANQRASIKLGTSLSSGQAIALHLKASGSNYNNGVVEVAYTQGSGVQITLNDGKTSPNWLAVGGATALSLIAGDTLSAEALSSGVINVYKNGALVSSQNASGQAGSLAWSMSRTGQVGLWTNAAGALLDDFDGGTLGGANAPGAAKVWAKPAAQATPPTGGWTRSYYYFGGSRVAMRERTSSANNGTVTWLHGDHLGSASLTTNASGQKIGEMRYKPFGEVRSEWWASGTASTDLLWTGQRRESSNYVGSINDFNARFFSPIIGRFVSADTIVPNFANPQSLNRFSYVRNSPLNFIDPTGHAEQCDEYTPCGGGMDKTEYYINKAKEGIRDAASNVFDKVGYILPSVQVSYARVEIGSCDKNKCTGAVGEGFYKYGPSNSIVTLNIDKGDAAIGAPPRVTGVQINLPGDYSVENAPGVQIPIASVGSKQKIYAIVGVTEFKGKIVPFVGGQTEADLLNNPNSSGMAKAGLALKIFYLPQFNSRQNGQSSDKSKDKTLNVNPKDTPKIPIIPLL